MIVLALCILARFIFAFPLDNTLLPAGSDHSFHLFQTWYIAEKGLTKWDYYWDAGEPIFRYYPPLAHAMAGALGKLVGFLLAYKLLGNLFMALAPIAFFFFIREFKLPEGQTLLALVFFTFILVYPYYLFDGRYPSIVNVVFILAFWTLLKRHIDSGGIGTGILSSVFLGLAVLTHHTTVLIMLPIIFAWALAYNPRRTTAYGIIGISLLAFLLTSWWTIPFLIETTSNNPGGYANAVSPTGLGQIVGEVETRIGTFGILDGSVYSFALLALVALTAVGCLLSLPKIRERNTRAFWILAALIIFVLSVVKFKRAFIFLPIPVAVLIAEGASMLKNNVRMAFSGFLILMLIVTFFVPKPQLAPYPYYPSIPNSGRVLFQPFGNEFNTGTEPNLHKYSILLAPVHGDEIILPWYVLAPDQIGAASTTYSIQKTLYDSLLQDTINTGPEKHYELLKEGDVNNIIVNTRYSEMVDFYNNSSRFRLVKIDGGYAIFEPSPLASYVEVNGKAVTGEPKKSLDSIHVEFDCEPGNVTVKETYNQNWVAFINGNAVKTSQTVYGFTVVENDNITGRCTLDMAFREPSYSTMSLLISASALLAVIVYLAYAARARLT